MSSRKQKAQVRIQSKRNVELWIYSFADMYMIISVFFIALSVIYASKMKQEVEVERERVTTAGRGPSSVVSDVQVNFEKASALITQEAETELRLFLPVLRGVKNGQIDVEGYSDGAKVPKDSGFSSNLDLSNRRAVHVAEWLIQNGISARKIRTFAYGDGQIFSASQVGTNRRVVIKVAVQGENHE